MEKATSPININVDSRVKRESTEILNSLGLNMTSAINIYLNQIIIHNGIPFEITNRKPSKRLKKALKEASNIESGKTKAKKYRNVDELFDDLDCN